MKIAVIVQGRFHAFDLARSLIARGNDVTLLTNYPKWAVRRFGISPANVRSCWHHGIASRALERIGRNSNLDFDRILKPWFDGWALSQLQRGKWDVVHGWSGVSENVLATSTLRATIRLVMRGSAHIRAQDRILADEEVRTGSQIERPKPWIIAREEREYDLADGVVVLSTFAYKSFVKEGFNSRRLHLLPLGSDLNVFRPSEQTLAARIDRITRGEPLRVIYTGTISFQKGLWDLAQVVRRLPNKRFQFRCIGPVAPEAEKVVSGLRGVVEFIPKQPQEQLPDVYAWGDLFLFPTLQDGFAVVLAQANASGLPIITTTNSCGPDLIHEGKTGWIVPIRSSETIIERLEWCDSHREELADMGQCVSRRFTPRDWNDVAADFERICSQLIATKRKSSCKPQ